MYSYEDRIRAIELYLKLGKRQAATRRQLGYPSKSSLLLWCQEYQRRQDLAPESPRVSRRQFCLSQAVSV